jgi:hypothetical protein
MTTTQFPFSLAVTSGKLEYNESAFRLVNHGELNQRVGGFVESKGEKADRAKGKTLFRVPLLNVLWATVNDGKKVTISILIPAGERLALKNLDGEIASDAETVKATEEWITGLMSRAYSGMSNTCAIELPRLTIVGIKSARKLKVLLNPVGGKVISKELGKISFN